MANKLQALYTIPRFTILSLGKVSETRCSAANGRKEIGAKTIVGMVGTGRQECTGMEQQVGRYIFRLAILAAKGETYSSRDYTPSGTAALDGRTGDADID